ncbi:MAG: FHA domain-containing protein [Anaerolineae bacterium]
MSEDEKKSHDIEKDPLSETIGDASQVGDMDQKMEANPSRIQTAMLNDPDVAEPMVERMPDANTAMLSLGWRIQFKIGDQKKTLPLKSRITIGRAVDSDANADEINLDLTPFGAYHFGVSRHHAVMTLSDGYLYLEDLGSTNGTRINGFQLTAGQKYRLRDGDEIEFARLRSNILFKGPDAS